MAQKTLTDGDALSALTTPEMVPPQRPANFADGATANLRDAMARFSNAADHGPRRSAVDATIATIDLTLVEQTAAAIMAERLDGDTVDMVGAGWAVPSFTLATIFGFGDQRQQVRDDVESIARVIGRGEASNPEADAAATRLLALFGDHPEPVAPVSILYQNFDATGALLPTMVMAAFAASGPPAAGRTVRVAKETLAIGDHLIEAGETVSIDLEHHRWGAGPHQCPGEALANAIVAGALRSIVEHRFNFRASLVEIDDRNVPTTFVMQGPK